MCGIAVHIPVSEAKKLLRTENPYMYDRAKCFRYVEMAGRFIPVECIQPNLHEENYMKSTGAKLYFQEGKALLSGYHWRGDDVTDLVLKYNLTVLQFIK